MSSSADYSQLLKKNDREQDKLKKLTGPLADSFGIDVFWHSTMRSDGFLSAVINYSDASHYFWENQWYKDMAFYVSPDNLRAGCFLLDHDLSYDNYIRKTSEMYPLYHPFLVIRKDDEGTAHLFGFSSTRLNPALPSLYVNNLPLLNSYMDYFLASNPEYASPDTENMVDIATLRGADLYYGKTYGNDSLVNPDRYYPFLKQIGVPPTLLAAAAQLTPREKQVLAACVEGKTAAESGKLLGLSTRTVQSYVENTKNRLGILTRQELLASGQILKMAGLLTA